VLLNLNYVVVCMKFWELVTAAKMDKRNKWLNCDNEKIGYSFFKKILATHDYYI